MLTESRELRWITLALLLPVLGACGFTLRGSEQTTLAIDTLYLESTGQGRLLSELERELRAAGVTVREGHAAEGDHYRLALSDITRDARRTTLNTGSRGAQYELSLSVTANLYLGDRRVDGPETLSVLREQDEDISNLTSTSGERDLLYDDMQRDLARRLMQRLRALQPVAPVSAPAGGPA